MRRLALAIVAVLAISTVPRPVAAAPLSALPATIRVNIAGLGTTYAKIGSTGTVTVTNSSGAVVYQGGRSTLTRLQVRRVAGRSGPALRVPDPDQTESERRSRAQEQREARLAARLGEITLVSIPFEFAVESADPLVPPLFSSQSVVPLRFTSSDALLSYNGRAFRGTLELAKDDDGDMIVVNEVDTAAYLASVVGSEEPKTWMPEALAAQAIAARTYLVTHLRRHARYDLEGDVRDQQYDGISGEDKSTLRAVERTAGLVATYRGAPIEALYSANAGGITEDSENVYANALPYLRSVPSPGDSAAETSSWGRTSWQWTTEFTAPQLHSYLLARGVDVGEPQRIDVGRLSSSGRVVSARIVGSSGSRDIGKDAARYYFGLRSTLFSVAVRPEETEVVTNLDTQRIRQLELLGATVERPLFSKVRDPERSLTLRFNTWLYRLPARFVFSGKGFGHGVGMSQWGAQGMALSGASAEGILKHYYRGIEITNIGGA